MIMCVNTAVDPKNQSILNRMKKIDPKGVRTLGLLTKPDCIMIGEEEEKMRMFRNEGGFKCQRGWSVIKCSNQRQLEAKLTPQVQYTKNFDDLE